MQTPERLHARPKPPWLKVRPPEGEKYFDLKRRMRNLNLTTVCEEAHCPNVSECWNGGTATFMLMGEVCTRGCRFCAVTSGHPGALDPREPEHLAEAIHTMGLRYAVVTSVNRDDLPDGGAAHFASCVRAVKARCPETLVEILVPDFEGKHNSLDRVIEASPDVVAHNVETVESLTPTVRDRRAGYRQSLAVLAYVKRASPRTFTKSSLMLGVGEGEEEVLQTMRDLRAARVDILTLGQYLQPTKKHLPVVEFVSPERFRDYERRGFEEGFLYVAAGPLVRSSYRAGEFFLDAMIRRGRASTAEHERTSSYA